MAAAVAGVTTGIFLTCMSVPVMGSTFLPVSDAELTAESDVVVTGTVSHVASRRAVGSGRVGTSSPVAEIGRIVTDYTVVVATATQAVPAEVIFTLPGGVVAGFSERVLDVPVFYRGDRVRLYLRTPPPARRPTMIPDPRRYRLTGMVPDAAVLIEPAAGPARVDRYTFYSNGGDTYLRWYADSIDVFVDSALTPDVNPTEAANAIDASMAAWNDVACTHPTLVNAGLVSGIDPIGPAPSGAGLVGNNLIIFEDMARWNENRDDLDEWDTSKTVALSTMFHQPGTGAIQSFALELNDDAFAFGVTGTFAAIDIQNTVTHELGHILGLDHTGSDVPGYFSQTMYYQTSAGETKKRSLEDDDKAGLCALYATEWKDAGGCAATAGGDIPEHTGIIRMLVILGSILIMIAVGRRNRGATAGSPAKYWK